MSIEVITLKHFSALPQTGIKASTKSCPRHAVFHSLFLDDSKQDSVTTTAHSKHLIEKNFLIAVSIQYNMVKYWWLCRSIYMCLCTIIYVSFVPILLYYNWSRYKCTCTWQRGGLWSQCHLQALYIYQLMFNVKLTG